MLSNRQISVIIPVIRPTKAQACVASIRKNAGIPESQYEILTMEDHERIGCPKMVKQMTAAAKYPLVCFVGDDTLMEPDCLKNALAAMNDLPNHWGLVALNDHHPRKQMGTASHWLAHKNLLPHLDGEFFHTGYKHAYCDNELAELCQAMGRYVWAENAGVTHDHPIHGAPTDADYDRVYSSEISRHDHKLFLDRKNARGAQSYAIGFPLIEERVPIQFMISFIAMEKPDYRLLMPNFPVGSFIGNISDVRNNLVTQAFNEYCTHLIMCDTDQIYPSDCIRKLIEHNLPVVGTPVHRRYPPFDPILYRGTMGKYLHVSDEECYSGDLVQVDATGTGCILFDLRVFWDMPKPWFEMKKGSDGKTVGEDIGLCAKLRQRGIPIAVDTSIQIDHLTTYSVNRATYELYKKINRFQYREAA